MYVSDLALSGFRNYAAAEVSFSPHLNFIFGHNAQGKTNFLEALYLLCLGRSFRLANNQELLSSDTGSFLVKANIVKDNNLTSTIVVNYLRDGKKEISINRKRLQSHSKIFGQFPVVIMAPDEFKITTAGPSERRRFLDVLLSQVSISYLSDLQEYHRILRQRNRILQNLRAGHSVNEPEITPWTESLILFGCRIMRFRERFIRDFSAIVTGIYSSLTNSKDQLQMALQCSVGPGTSEGLEEQFWTKLRATRSKERMLGSTQVGPHRDDLTFLINEMDLRKYGSRGEHKSVLLALKVGEFKYLRQQLQETPLLLLDDCYSELDNCREESFLKSIDGLGQVFLTTPKENILLDHSRLFGGNTATFKVVKGQISCEK